MAVFVFQCCRNQLLQIQWLKTAPIYYLIFLQVRGLAGSVVSVRLVPKAKSKVLARLESRWRLLWGSVPGSSQVVGSQLHSAAGGESLLPCWLLSDQTLTSLCLTQNIYEMSSTISSLSFFKMEWGLKTLERETEHRILQNFLSLKFSCPPSYNLTPPFFVRSKHLLLFCAFPL